MRPLFQGLLSSLAAAAIVSIVGWLYRSQRKRSPRFESIEAVADELMARSRRRSWGNIGQLVEIPAGLAKFHISPDVERVQIARVRRPNTSPTTFETEQVATLREAAKGRLLLVGSSGSGKTVLALRIARQLEVSKAAGVGDHVPVVLGVGTWAGESMIEWVRSHITNTQFGLGLKGEGVARLLSSGRVTVIVDSLEGLDDELLPAFSQELSRFLAEQPVEQEVILTCQPCTYQRISTELGANNGFDDLDHFQVKSLTHARVVACLDEIHNSRELSRGATNRLPSTVLDNVPQLIEALSSPLMLSLIAETDVSIEDLESLDDAGQISDYLTAAKVDAALAEPHAPIGGPAWIVAIALSLTATDTTRTAVFFENMTPAKTSPEVQRFVAFSFAAFWGIWVGLRPLVLYADVRSGLASTLSAIVLYWFIARYGKWYGLAREPSSSYGFDALPANLELVFRPVRRVNSTAQLGTFKRLLNGARLAMGRYSSGSVDRDWLWWFAIGTVLAIGPFVRDLSTPPVDWGGVAFALFMFPLFLGPLFGFVLATLNSVGMSLLQDRSEGRGPEPDWAIRVSRQSWLSVFIAIMVPWFLLSLIWFGLGLWLGEESLRSNLTFVSNLLLFGAFFGGITSVNYGGGFYLEQLRLRRRLKNDRTLPDEPARVMAWAVDSRLFQRVDGGFQFRHVLLRDAAARRVSEYGGPSFDLYWPAEERATEVSRLQKAFHKGDFSAAYELGEIFADIRPEDAWYWFERAAQQGHLASIRRLAQLAETTRPGEVEQWLRRASDLGDLLSRRRLAEHLADRQRFEEAVEVYRQLDAQSMSIRDAAVSRLQLLVEKPDSKSQSVTDEVVDVVIDLCGEHRNDIDEESIQNEIETWFFAGLARRAESVRGLARRLSSR